MTYAVVLLLAIASAAWALIGEKLRGEWKRENPLPDPMQRVSVAESSVTFADGTHFRLDGIRRDDSVSANDFYQFLWAVTSQGVEIIKREESTEPLAIVEPKFYNWCGTSSSRWAGSYFQWPLKELLIISGYASIDRESFMQLDSVAQSRLLHANKWRYEQASNQLWRTNARHHGIYHNSDAPLGPVLAEELSQLGSDS
ncbi:MAG: hypothetical protein AB8F26_07540 [Phycisphaerales bacterium]